MKALARALINAAAYLDLSGEEGLDPEQSLQALEELAFNLSHCNEAEIEALREVLADMRAAEMDSGPRLEMLEFLDTFLVSFGVEADEQLEDTDPPPRINLL